MKYEVTVRCCVCWGEIRTYVVDQEPPGDVRLDAHEECKAFVLAAVEQAAPLSVVNNN